jgi:hypothetical protein
VLEVLAYIKSTWLPEIQERQDIWAQGSTRPRSSKTGPNDGEVPAGAATGAAILARAGGAMCPPGIVDPVINGPRRSGISN